MINFRIFIIKLQGCVDRHAPIKKLTPKEIKLVQKPWISKELNKMIKINYFIVRKVNHIIVLLKYYYITNLEIGLIEN